MLRNLPIGKSIKLIPRFLDQMNRPIQVDNATISYSSDTPSVATVDGNGNVMGVTNGTANITATSGSMSNSTTITVYTPVVSSIVI